MAVEIRLANQITLMKKYCLYTIGAIQGTPTLFVPKSYEQSTPTEGVLYYYKYKKKKTIEN